MPARKVIVGLATYTYDYGRAGERSQSRTFAEARAIAAARGKTIVFDPSQKNLHFAYEDGGVTHQVWMLDAASAFNQIKAASTYKPAGFAFWRLGAEDPSLWEVVPKRDALDGSVAGALASDGRTVAYEAATGLIEEQRIQP